MGKILSTIFLSSANLVKYLLPGKARYITEQNNIIKRAILGISRISNDLNNIDNDAVHVSFFIQDQEGFSNKGIILDYGQYEYINDEKLVFEYREEGGLRFGYIDYQTFMDDSGRAAIVNLNISKSNPIRFNYLIDTIKKNGNWRYKDYSTLFHNSQDFAVEVIKILKPKFDPLNVILGTSATLLGRETLDEIIPKKILKALKSV